MIGPIGRLATEEEIDAYLRLKTADEAKQFIDAFWAKRDPDPAQGRQRGARALPDPRRGGRQEVLGGGGGGAPHRSRHHPRPLRRARERRLRGVPRRLRARRRALALLRRRPRPGSTAAGPSKEYRFAKLGDLTRFYSAREMRESTIRGGAATPRSPASRRASPASPAPRASPTSPSRAGLGLGFRLRPREPQPLAGAAVAQEQGSGAPEQRVGRAPGTPAA